MKVCVLASGSSGNCTYISSDTTAILIDAGLSARETGRRLGLIGVELPSIQAVCVTHEHGDHIAGLGTLHQRHRIPVFANSATAQGILQSRELSRVRCTVFATGAAFGVGDLGIEPFSVPHNALDPVGFVIQSGGTKVGFVTDLGMVTELIRDKLGSCHVIVLETNHDKAMVRDSTRPWSVKQQTLSRQGHLSNEEAAEVLGQIAGPHLRHVFLAHISEECNRREMVLDLVRRELDRKGHQHVGVSLTHADRISDIWAG